MAKGIWYHQRFYIDVYFFYNVYCCAFCNWQDHQRSVGQHSSPVVPLINFDEEKNVLHQERFELLNDSPSIYIRIC